MSAVPEAQRNKHNLQTLRTEQGTISLCTCYLASRSSRGNIQEVVCVVEHRVCMFLYSCFIWSALWLPANEGQGSPRVQTGERGRPLSESQTQTTCSCSESAREARDTHAETDEHRSDRDRENTSTTARLRTNQQLFILYVCVWDSLWLLRHLVGKNSWVGQTRWWQIWL